MIKPDGPSAPPIAQAFAIGNDSGAAAAAEAAVLREQLAAQEQKIGAQEQIIAHQAAQMGKTRHRGKYLVGAEDKRLRMAFLRQRACAQACTPLRAVPSLVMGWAAIWVFIWCYLWNVMTTLAMWIALQSLHIFSCCNSPFVEYAQFCTQNYAGQQNCWWWKAKYKLEGPDNDHMVYVV